MSLNDLQKKIEEQGRAEAGKVEREAKNTSGEELSKANKEAKGILAKADADIEEEARRLSKEYEANSEIARNGIILAAQEEVVEKAMKSVRKDIVREMRAKQKRIFDSAIKAAKEIDDIKDMTIFVNRRDVDMVKKLGASISFADISGGLKIQSDDKSVTIDASIDTMVDGKSDEIRSIINHTLFGAGESAARNKEKTSAKAPEKKSAKKKAKSAPKKKAARKAKAVKKIKKAAKAKKGKKAKK